jgi:hypothetical protein
MEIKELKDKLAEYRPYIVVSGKEIDKDHEKVKDFIELYHKLTGKRVGEGTCRNCILDAYMDLSMKTENQLKTMIMPSKYKMKEGRVVIFNNTDYTNANMTDEVALQMVAFNTKHAANFLNGDELLKAYNGITEKVEVESEDVSDEEPTVPTLEELRANYKEIKGKKPHWKWDEATILEKLNED